MTRGSGYRDGVTVRHGFVMVGHYCSVVFLAFPLDFPDQVEECSSLSSALAYLMPWLWLGGRRTRLRGLLGRIKFVLCREHLGAIS